MGDVTSTDQLIAQLLAQERPAAYGDAGCSEDQHSPQSSEANNNRRPRRRDEARKRRCSAEAVILCQSQLNLGCNPGRPASLPTHRQCTCLLCAQAPAARAWRQARPRLASCRCKVKQAAGRRVQAGRLNGGGGVTPANKGQQAGRGVTRRSACSSRHLNNMAAIGRSGWAWYPGRFAWYLVKHTPQSSGPEV